MIFESLIYLFNSHLQQVPILIDPTKPV